MRFVDKRHALRFEQFALHVGPAERKPVAQAPVLEHNSMARYGVIARTRVGVAPQGKSDVPARLGPSHEARNPPVRAHFAFRNLPDDFIYSICEFSHEPILANTPGTVR